MSGNCKIYIEFSMSTSTSFAFAYSHLIATAPRIELNSWLNKDLKKKSKPTRFSVYVAQGLRGVACKSTLRRIVAGKSAQSA